MTLLPQDRRGLGEIVALASMIVAVAGVIVVEVVRGVPVQGELIAALIALCVLVTGRGVQSATERSASSQFHTREAYEMKLAAEEFKSEAKRLREMAFEMIERQLPPPPVPPTDKEPH